MNPLWDVGQELMIEGLNPKGVTTLTQYKKMSCDYKMACDTFDFPYNNMTACNTITLKLLLQGTMVEALAIVFMVIQLIGNHTISCTILG